MAIYLIVGRPGAGRPTRAKELEASESAALRLTPDDWQIGIFDGDDRTRWRSEDRAEHRDRIGGKLIKVGILATRSVPATTQDAAPLLPKAASGYRHAR